MREKNTKSWKKGVEGGFKLNMVTYNGNYLVSSV
jgi:hypothetical protein